jgi:Triose-phosphate Transporter family
MSVSSSSSLELLPSSGESRSTPIPTPPRFSWFHQASSCEIEFSPNASFSPRGLVVFDATGCLDQRPGFEHQTDVAAGSFLEGIEREGKGAIGPGVNLDGTHPNSYKVIRSRPIRSLRDHHRAFHHTDQTYSHLSLQTSHSWNSEELQFELPQPTSPTRPRRFSLRRTWLVAFNSCFRLRHLRYGPTIYLSLYFVFNLGLTLYNKSLLIHFPFPYTLSAVHALCGSIGSIVLIRAGSSPPPRLNLRETLIILAFSVLYTVNIIISNLSLGLVTVPVCRFSKPFSFPALILRSSIKLFEHPRRYSPYYSHQLFSAPEVIVSN